jgi:hypothetical protein
MTRWQRRAGVHVADAVIAAGREPTADEEHHLAACPGCFADVRRSRAFDRQLRESVASIASTSITREVLTVPVPSIRRPPTPSLTSLGVIAALVVAAGLVTWTVLPRAETGSTASRAPLASHDPHVVILGDRRLEVRLDGRAVSLRSSTGYGPLEILASIELGDVVNGNFAYALRCPGGSDQPPIRAVFGRLTPDEGAPADAMTYTGPKADGQIAPDGLFLFVLSDTSTSTAPIKIVNSNGGVGFGTRAFDPEPSATPETSGCFVIG